MASKHVEEALKRADPSQQERNQKVIDDARRSIDFKTMKDVDEITAPIPKPGEPDPDGAARMRLDPGFRDKIEQIQKHGANYYNENIKEEEGHPIDAAIARGASPIENPAVTEPVIMDEMIFVEPVL